MDVTVVLPCYNEAAHVRQEIDRICAALDASGYRYEVLAVDDASTDTTLDELRKAAAERPAVQVVQMGRNGGAGTVRRLGSRMARGEIVVWTDADLTYPNERIPELVRRLREDDSVDRSPRPTGRTDAASSTRPARTPGVVRSRSTPAVRVGIAGHAGPGVRRCYRRIMTMC